MLWLIYVFLATIIFSVTCGCLCFYFGITVEKNRAKDRNKTLAKSDKHYYRRQSMDDEERGIRRDRYSDNSEYESRDDYETSPDESPPPKLKIKTQHKRH